MKKIITITIAKILIFLGRLLHRGSALPGDIALRIYPDILRKISIPTLSIAVTGTTGKTSTTQMIAKVFEESGFLVSHNISGSNLIGGVATLLLNNVTISGKSKADVLVLEIDERYAKIVFEYFKPNYFVVTNLSRDQLARNGHFDIVYEDIKRVISDDMHLVLNADDPLVVQLVDEHKGKVTYFGVGKHSDVEHSVSMDNLDLCYCPKCHKKLIFDYYHFGNLGSYHCPSGDFVRPKCDYEVTNIEMATGEFEINNKVKIHMQYDALYNIYNNLVVYAVGNLCLLKDDTILSVLNGFNYQVKRFEKFTLAGRSGYILTSKNETPISYYQSLKYVSKDSDLKTIIVGFLRVSGRYELKDLSWLWDVDFELLDNDSIDKVVCVGPYADELAARIWHAGIDENKLVKVEASNKLLETVENKTAGTIYAIVYFDMAKELSAMLEGKME